MWRIGLRPWVLLFTFSFLLFLITSSTYSSLGVVLPRMVADLHWSFQQAGLGFTLLGVMTGASSYFPALVIRRLGVRATLLIGTGVMALGFYCLSAAHGLTVYFLGTGLCGVGFQMMALIPGTHVLAAAFRRRAMAFGFYFTAGALGGVAGPLVVLGLMHLLHDQWRLFWLVQMAAAIGVGALCVVAVGGSGWMVKASERAETEVPHDHGAKPSRLAVFRTPRDWTVRDAVRTPQFYVLLAAYFGHLMVGITVASWSVSHLTERGISLTVAGTMLSFEGLAQIGGRMLGGLVGDYIDPRYLLVLALGALAIGSAALSVADSYTMMILYAVGSGLGFGLTALAVTVLLINYYGRRHNLEIFSLTCLIGAVSAFGPLIGGMLRDQTGSFALTFQLSAGVIAAIFLAALFMRPPRGPGVRTTADGEAARPDPIAGDPVQGAVTHAQ
jgi:MFS family permease